MTKHTGPKKLQTKPSSVDSQQLRLGVINTRSQQDVLCFTEIESKFMQPTDVITIKQL